MPTLLLGILEQVLKLGVLKEEHKYLDKVLELKRNWYHEFQKPDDEISHQRLDDIDLELRLLTESITEAFKSTKA